MMLFQVEYGVDTVTRVIRAINHVPLANHGLAQAWQLAGFDIAVFVVLAGFGNDTSAELAPVTDQGSNRLGRAFHPGFPCLRIRRINMRQYSQERDAKYYLSHHPPRFDLVSATGHLYDKKITCCVQSKSRAKHATTCSRPPDSTCRRTMPSPG
ncbi:MAG: hypothetical protein P8Z67_01105 [Gammaproteobacteria bacterium]